MQLMVGLWVTGSNKLISSDANRVFSLKERVFSPFLFCAFYANLGMSEKLNEVISILLKKHKPTDLFNSSDENFIWLNDIDQEDVKLLRSIKEEIIMKMEFINFRYSGSWFYYVCRRITVDEKLKKLILE